MPSGPELAGQLRWQDVVDVVVLTFVLYRVYTWMRGTAGLQILLSMAALVAAAYGASAVGLMLTAYVLQALGAVAALVMVVVFRDEIRRGLRRVDPLRILRARRAGRDRGERRCAALADAALALAARRIGALVVLPRGDRVDEHLTGGTMLDAEPSRALFESIFHVGSPLHDGALVMQGGRVRLAGSFLPLTRSAHVSPSHGTRHRAALGLSEACDAVVLVVSEERGEVSLVVDGAIAPAPADVDRLAARLDELASGGEPPRTRRGRLIDMVALATIFTLVLGAWFVVLGGPGAIVIRTVAVEVQDVPDTLEVESLRPAQVQVHLRGPRTLLTDVADGVTAFVSVGAATPGQRRIAVTTVVPTGIDVVEVVPRTITVRLRSEP